MGAENAGSWSQKLKDAFSPPGLPGGRSDDPRKVAPNGQISQPGIKNGQGILISGLGGGTIEQNTYSIQFKNWWKALPYGFRYNPRSSSMKPLLFMLPINPQNIQVRTPFATNIVSTAYGTVEEHSEIRYFDIVITGNTGITPKYSQIIDGRFDPSDARQSHMQRFSYSTKSLIPSDAAKGFFRRTLNQAQQAVKGVQGVAAAISGNKPIQTGVQQAYTGFAAFHNFFRFLMEYKRDTSGVASPGQRSRHPLQFINYKDGVEYDAAIQEFSWVKNASDPFLYNYTIVMRCYNIRTIENPGAIDNIAQRYEQLGLNGIETSSAFSRIASGARSAKNAAFAAAAVASGGYGF